LGAGKAGAGGAQRGLWWGVRADGSGGWVVCGSPAPQEVDTQGDILL